MDIAIIFSTILVSGIFVIMVAAFMTIIRDIKHIKNKLFTPEKKYDEYCVKPLNTYTTFRVVPYTNGLGKKMWNVEYRNPADTIWKVCRCEESLQKANDQMNDIIKRIKDGDL